MVGTNGSDAHASPSSGYRTHGDPRCQERMLDCPVTWFAAAGLGV